MILQAKKRNEVRQKVMDTEKIQHKLTGEKEQGLHLVLLFPAPLRHARLAAL